MDEGQSHRSTRCTATPADGSPCPSRASLGHGPCGAAAEGNQNPRTHGFYAHRDVPDAGWTVDTLVGRSDCQASEAKPHADLSDYIGRLLEDGQTDPRDIARLFALYRVSAARLERLLQERQIIHRTSGRLQTIAALAGVPAAGTPAADRSAAGKPEVER